MSPDDDDVSREDRAQARIDSPSLTGRVRSLGLRPMLRSQDGMTSRTQSTDSRRETGDENDDVAIGNSTLLSPVDRSEDEFRAEALQLLHPSNTTSSRVSALRIISPSLPSFSISTLSEVLDVIEDLTQVNAPARAREATFALISTASTTPNLSDSDQQRLFDLALIPASSGQTESQIKAIIALSNAAPILKAVQPELIKFLNEVIRSQYIALSEARRRAAKSSDRPRGPLVEEKGLHLVLSFLSRTLKDGVLQFDDEAIENLVQGAVYIAEKTTSKTDMRNAVELLQTIIRISTIPQPELKSCVEILCAITNAIHDLNEITWDCLSLLLNSSKQEEMIRILLDTLSLAPTDRHSHTVCGALSVLLQLMSNREEHLPKVEFARFIESLWGVHFAGRRIRRDTLKTIRSLLLDPDLREETRRCSWDHLVQIILTAVGDETYIHDRTSEPLTIRHYGDQIASERSAEKSETPGDMALADEIYYELKQLADAFNSQWQQLSPDQRQLVGMFYYKLRLIIPAPQIKTLLVRLHDEQYFKPGELHWQSHQIEMVRLFIWGRETDSSIGCYVIQILQVTVSQAQSQDLEHFHMLVLRLLNDFEAEVTIPVANELADFARLVWRLRVPLHLAENLDRFMPLIQIRKDKTSTPSGDSSEETSNEVVTAFVSLYLDYFETKAAASSPVYEFLVKIAKAREIPATSRLDALRLLVRLRCNDAGNVMVIQDPDTLGLAAHVSRAESLSIRSGETGKPPERSDGPQTNRQTRASTLSQSSQGNLRSSLRMTQDPDSYSKGLSSKPLWIYGGRPGLPRFPSREPNPMLHISSDATDTRNSVRLSDWLIAVIDILQQSGDWEVYSHVLVHLPSQLGNPALFSNAIPHIKMLRNVIASQLLEGHFQEAPPESGVRKGDVAVCLFSALAMLLAYCEEFARAEQDDMVRAFIGGIWGWDRTPKICIQAIAIACHQIPAAVTRHLQAILQRMSQVITQSQLSVDILEFLGGLARLPAMYVNFREDDYRLVFGICIRYLEHARDQRLKATTHPVGSSDVHPSRASGLSVRSAPSFELGSQLDIQRDLPQYVYALTHHVITVWFLSVKLADRPNHVEYIASNLVGTNQHLHGIMDEQSQVTLDMMQRTAYLDLGETNPTVNFDPAVERTLRKSWIIGMSIVTVETGITSGLSQLTKRQASGTTHACYQQGTAALPPHHVAGPVEYRSSLGNEHLVQIFPNHVLLQLTSTIAPLPTPMEPIGLPDDDMTRRALASFDRNDTVDGYKVGVIYVGPGQIEESAILANISGSKDYAKFLDGLGTKVRLKDATFNTQGLDRSEDTDGEYTYAWRDRITELVFHIPTMMPNNLETDPACVMKKRHIGNDFVKVIWNESGLPFEFDTFSSQFNYVNIVITPEAGCRGSGPSEESISAEKGTRRTPNYTIQTITSAHLPDISATATCKLLSLANMPALVRHIALHSAIFSNLWVTREGGDHVSSWRNRLREIVKLRERHSKTGTRISSRLPEDRDGARKYAPGDCFTGRVGMGGVVDEDAILASLDFSRWTGPN